MINNNNNLVHVKKNNVVKTTVLFLFYDIFKSYEMIKCNHSSFLLILRFFGNGVLII